MVSSLFQYKQYILAFLKLKMNELFGVDIRKQLFPQKRKKKRHLDGGILGNLKSDDTVERHGTSAKAKLRRKRKQLSVLASLSCNMDKHEKSVLVDIPSNPPFNSSSLGGSGVLAEIGNLGATQTHLKRKDTKTKKLMKGKKHVQTSVLEILSCDSTTNMAHQSPHLRSGKAYEETKRLISFSSDVRKRRNSKHNAQKRCQEKRKLDSTKGEEKTQIRKKKKSTGGDEFENKRARSNVGPRRNIERESICMEDLEKQSRESGLLNDTSHEDLKQYSIADESVSVSCPSPLSLLPDLAIKETSTSHVDKSLEENKKVTSEAINDEMPKEMPRDVIPSDTIVVKTNVTASCKSYMRLFQEDNTSDATRTKKKLEPEGNKAISKHFHSDQVDGDVCSDIDNQSQFDNNSIRLEKEGDTQSSTLKEIQSERKVEAPRITKEDASRPTGARTPHEAQSFAVDDSMSASSTSNSIPVFVQFYDHAKNEQILESGSAADHSSLSTCSKAKIPAGQPMLSGDDDEKEVSTGIRNPGSIHLEESVSSEKKCFCGIEGSGDLEHKTGKIAASASTADAYGSCVLEIDYLVPFCASSKADVPGPHTLEIDCYLQSHAASKIPKTKEIGLGGVVPLPHSALELPTDATETKVNPPENCIKSVTSPLSDSIFSNIDHDSPTTHRKCKDQIREGTSMRSRKITKSGDEKKNKFEATSGNQRKSLRQRIKTNRYSPTIKRRKRPQKDRFAKTTEVDVPISNEVERGLTIEESAVSGKVCSTSEHHEKLDLTSSEMKKNRQRKSMRQRIKTNRYSPPIESRKVAQNDCFAQKSQTDASILNKIEQGSSNEESVISGNAQWEPESHRRLDSVTENLVKPGSRTVADTISGQRKSSRQRIKTNRYSPCIESRKRTNDDLFSSNNSEEDITTSVKLEPVCNNREHLIPQTMCLLPNANEQMETAAENVRAEK